MPVSVFKATWEWALRQAVGFRSSDPSEPLPNFKASKRIQWAIWHYAPQNLRPAIPGTLQAVGVDGRGSRVGFLYVNLGKESEAHLRL